MVEPRCLRRSPATISRFHLYWSWNTDAASLFEPHRPRPLAELARNPVALIPRWPPKPCAVGEARVFLRTRARDRVQGNLSREPLLPLKSVSCRDRSPIALEFAFVEILQTIPAVWDARGPLKSAVTSALPCRNGLLNEVAFISPRRRWLRARNTPPSYHAQRSWRWRPRWPRSGIVRSKAVG